MTKAIPATFIVWEEPTADYERYYVGGGHEATRAVNQRLVTKSIRWLNDTSTKTQADARAYMLAEMSDRPGRMNLRVEVRIA